MKQYEIQIKYYYGEASDYGAEVIEAASKTEALKKLARMKKILTVKVSNYEEWRWWEGVWLGRVKCVGLKRGDFEGTR